MESVEAAFAAMKTRIRSTHIHDNDGKEDKHLFPFVAEGGTIDWTQSHAPARARVPSSIRCCSN